MYTKNTSSVLERILKTDKKWKGISVIADVHGDIRSFKIALKHAHEKRHFVVGLGDLVDYGDHSLECLSLAASVRRQKRGIFLAGNHEAGLLRHVQDRLDRKVKPYSGRIQGLGRTIRQIDSHRNPLEVCRRIKEDIQHMPLWVTMGNRIFVHAAWHEDMNNMDRSPRLKDLDGYRHPCLYGYTGKEIDENGFAIRDKSWVDLLANKTEVIVGHDIINKDKPEYRESFRGGGALFLDTGCNKGGRLSVLDIPREGRASIKSITPSHILSRKSAEKTQRLQIEAA